MNGKLTPEIPVARLLASPRSPRAERDQIIRFADGRIVSVQPAGPDAIARGAGLLAMPALANAHDHARALKPVALGAVDLPLELWLAAISGAPRVDPFLVAAVALGRSALGGAGSVMVHYMRPQGGMSLVDEAREVARGARAVGVRIAFAMAMRDRNALAYGDDGATLELIDPVDRAEISRRLVPSAVSPDDQLRLAEEIAAAIESDLVTVQYGPTGVQWCSDTLLGRIAARSAETGRRVHMHLLETRYQREWADHAYPQGVVRHLDVLGLLSPRLSVAHAVWATPDELALLAERGVTVCVSNSSNLGLRSGIPPVREMVRAGIPIALGLDGVALDDDDDALREMRIAHMLHQGLGFDRWLDAAGAFQAASATARRAITGCEEQVILAPGAPADALVLDYAALSRDVIAEHLDDAALVLARATSRHIRGLYVAGREVVRDGCTTGVDLRAAEAELLHQARRGMVEFNVWQRIVRRTRTPLAGFYARRLHCG